MLKGWQIGVLAGLGVVLWGLVTFAIHAAPDVAVAAEGEGLRLLVVGPVGGVLSVWLCKLVGRLSDDEVVVGLLTAGTVAIVLDGLVLRWAPALYGQDEKVLRLAAADLMWGYGAAFAAALVWQWAALARRRTA